MTQRLLSPPVAIQPHHLPSFPEQQGLLAPPWDGFGSSPKNRVWECGAEAVAALQWSMENPRQPLSASLTLQQQQVKNCVFLWCNSPGYTRLSCSSHQPAHRGYKSTPSFVISTISSLKRRWMWPLALKSPLAGQAETHCGPHKGGWVLWEQRKSLSKVIFE